MRNNLLFTSSIAWLAFLGICLLIFQLVKAQITLPANNTAPESSSTKVNASGFINTNNPVVPTISFGSHECLDFSILPDLESTAQTKKFFEDIHYLGYIGRNGFFQSHLSSLSVQQMIANLMLKPDGIASLNTVQIAPNMLSINQLKDSYIFTNILIRDLNAMYSFTECSSEQIEVLNAAIGRLTYLKRIFKQELVANDTFDSILDSNTVTLDFMEKVASNSR